MGICGVVIQEVPRVLKVPFIWSAQYNPKQTPLLTWVLMNIVCHEAAMAMLLVTLF